MRRAEAKGWTFSRLIDLEVPSWSWASVMAPITFKHIDSRDHNAIAYEAQFLRAFSLESYPALHLKGHLTRMYPRNGERISPIPLSEQFVRRITDPIAAWEPDVLSVSAWNSAIYCFEIARANIYQLCLCLVRNSHLRPFGPCRPTIFTRVGMCAWNVAANGELPREDLVDIYIL